MVKTAIGQHGFSRLGHFGAVATGDEENTIFRPTQLQSHKGPYPAIIHVLHLTPRAP